MSDDPEHGEILHCYVSARALRALRRASDELFRPVEDLASAAIEEAAIPFDQRTPTNDPR